MQYTFNEGSFEGRRPDRLVTAFQYPPALASGENGVDRTVRVLESRDAAIGRVRGVSYTGRHW